MQTGYVVALAREARSLLKTGPLPLAEPISVGEDLIVVSGIGADAATAAATILIRQDVSRLVSWGTAGSLVSHLSSGTIVVPQILVAADNSRYQTTDTWRNDLVNELSAYLSVISDPLAEARYVLNSEAQKTALHETSLAVACDMESVAVAKTAAQAKLPFLAVRAIVDTLDLSLPRWLTEMLDSNGEPRIGPLLSGLCARPGDIARLIKLRRAFQRALTNLAHVHDLTSAQPGA
jgi:adenosylhomocysteine nucleosidase